MLLGNRVAVADAGRAALSVLWLAAFAMPLGYFSAFASDPRRGAAASVGVDAAVVAPCVVVGVILVPTIANGAAHPPLAAVVGALGAASASHVLALRYRNRPASSSTAAHSSGDTGCTESRLPLRNSSILPSS